MSWTLSADGHDFLTVDKDDFRLESERYSEAASRAAFRRVVEPPTPEQRRDNDLRNQQYFATCRLDALYLARREPSHAVVIERELDGRRLELYDRMRVCWGRHPNGGTRLTIDEARALQADFPLYLEGTIIRSL